MKRLFTAALAALALFAMPAWAEEQDATAQIVMSANDSITACMTAMAQGADKASPEMRGMILGTMASTCRQSVVVAQPQAKPDGWATAGRVLLGIGQMYFGYKGQAAMWAGITTLSGQGFATADSIATKGFDAVSKQPEVFITNTTPSGASLLYPDPAFGQ